MGYRCIGMNRHRFLNSKNEFILQYAYSKIKKEFAWRASFHEINFGFECLACMGWYDMTLLEILKEESPGDWIEVSKKQYEKKSLGPAKLRCAKKLLKEAERMMK